MQKQRRHHLRGERRLAQPARVAAGDLVQIEALSDDRNDQPGQVVFGHVILNARRQQMRLVDLPGPKLLAHSHPKNQTRRILASDYSDRLLAQRVRRSNASRWRRLAGRSPALWTSRSRNIRVQRRDSLICKLMGARGRPDASQGTRLAPKRGCLRATQISGTAGSPMGGPQARQRL